MRVWPLSDYAPDAEYLIARCFEVTGKDEAAFNAYQNIIKKYPHSDKYEDVLWRQYGIANRFLAGEWFRLWTYIPLFPSMDRNGENVRQNRQGTALTATWRRTRSCASARRERSREIMRTR